MVSDNELEINVPIIVQFRARFMPDQSILRPLPLERQHRATQKYADERYTN
jgi:hypothetical protein